MRSLAAAAEGLKLRIAEGRRRQGACESNAAGLDLRPTVRETREVAGHRLDGVTRLSRRVTRDLDVGCLEVVENARCLRVV